MTILKYLLIYLSFVLVVSMLLGKLNKVPQSKQDQEQKEYLNKNND